MFLSYILFVVFLSQLFDRKKLQKLPAHGLSKSLPFFARATLCEHSVERRLSLVSAVPISGTKELASRTPGIVWHTRSDTFVLIPQLELTRAVAQTVPDFFLILPFVGGLHQCRGEPVCLPKIRGTCHLDQMGEISKSMQRCLTYVRHDTASGYTSIGNPLDDGTIKNRVRARFCSGVSEEVFKVR